MNLEPGREGVAPRRAGRLLWLMAAVVAAALLVSASATAQKPRRGAAPAPEAPAAPDEPWLLLDEEAFAGYVEHVRSTMQVPGAAVVVVHRDKGVVFERGFGQGEGALASDAPVYLGPLSRSMTALVAMRLVEAGKLSLEAELGALLPDVAIEGALGPITVRHLLQHTSGLSPSQGVSLWLDPAAALGPLTPAQAPDQARRESLLNDALLGRVIEAVTGEPLADVMRRELFAPLEMASTHAGDGQPPGPGHLYLSVLTTPRPEPPHNPLVTPGGFIVSTARDMGRYLQAHLQAGDGESALLSEASFGVLHAPVDGAVEGATPGWERVQRGDEVHLERHGALGAFSASMVLVPERKLGVVVLANVNSLEGLAPRAISLGFVELLLTRTTQVFAFVEIVVRLLLGLMLLIGGVDLLIQLVGWARLGRPTSVEWDRRRVVRLSVALTWPLALLAVAWSLAPAPLWAMFTLQPDVTLLLVVGVPVMLARSVLKAINRAHREDVVQVA